MNSILNLFRRAAFAVRHAPGLRRLDPLWNRLRGPYWRLLDRNGRGVPFDLGGVTVRIPVESAQVSWDTSEPAAMRRFVAWIREHRGACVLDVGCASGIYSLTALTTADDCQVVAVDSHLPSLVAAAQLTRLAEQSRPRFVHGLISEQATSHESLDVAAASAALAMRDAGPPRIEYVNVGDAAARDVPVRTLSDLTAAIPREVPVLVKIDIEGAELLALGGAGALLDRPEATLLVSVHPAHLPRYGHSVADVRRRLEAAGYTPVVVAIDHEEHWWCERGSPTAAA